MASTVIEENLTFTQGTNGEESKFWVSACKSEIKAQRKKTTWNLVPRSEIRNILSSKKKFREKEVLSDNGIYSVEHKAILVPRGFLQIHEVDYEGTYARVARFAPIRNFLAVAAYLGLELHHIDVQTAFFNRDLDEDVYMEQPEGLVDAEFSDQVCKLVKALYGLKRAPRQWYAKIDALLKKFGFVNSTSDNCPYICRTTNTLTIITLCLDDLQIAWNDRSELAALKGELSEKFEIKDLSEAHVFLGLEITRDKAKKIQLISQSHYASKELERFEMHKSKPVVTLMDRQLGGRDDHKLATDILYRIVIGSLMYLTFGRRPDILFAVGRLCKFSDCPTWEHWTSAKHVLQFTSRN